ncbi:MAG: DNA mismatch repair protein MutS [Planctomycetes bacterium]|nr:DNA mismatch repair protein MutS [Planctomycetota bacterium]
MTTPMMQQYRDAKAKHPDMLLLFRMGDFYELFENDAETAHKVLGLTLTSRDKELAMAGFPHHQLENYLHKLLKEGFRVAVCDQVEDASQAKGLVRREVTRVVTPGTITEDDLLDPKANNHLVAILPTTAAAPTGLAWLDVSTGQFFAMDVMPDRLREELARLAPAECICPETHANALGEIIQRLANVPSLSQRPDWTFDPKTARDALGKHFAVSTFAGFGFDDSQCCLSAAGALLLYVQEMLKTDLAHIRRLQPYFSHKVLQLDDVTRRSLELTRTLREGERHGSLLAAIDRTVTTMGARLLQDWLLAPLADRTTIEARLDGVTELLEQSQLRGELRQSLGDVHDLQRLTARASTGRALPRDLAAIARTLRFLPTIKAKIAARKSALLRELEAGLELCPDLRATLDAALVDDPPLSGKDGGVIKPGYARDLDELRDIAKGGKEWIARFQASEIARTGINSLKVGFNSVFGYYIEITHTHTAKVPDGYQRKQTLKNAERYITPELKEYEEKVLSAEEKSQAREYELFLQLREQVAKETHRLLQTGEVLAHLDVLASLADLAVSRQYVRPELSDEPILRVVEGRHPVLDQTLPPGTFVPNDVALGNGNGMFLLITGPNMAGKSTYIRQVALLVLLAQIGSYVPARSATVGIADRIFTRVGASDELSRGQSTFMVEMTEAANILNNASLQSLVILDEIGRGTSTYDGVSLAWAITEHLHNTVGCRTLFATHYHELAQLAETLPNLRNCNVLVREWQDDIVFLHKIAPGSADKSYGIHVARLAGIPADVLERAAQVLKQLETHHLDEELPKVRLKRTKKVIREVMPTLFEMEEDA